MWRALNVTLAMAALIVLGATAQVLAAGTDEQAVRMAVARGDWAQVGEAATAWKSTALDDPVPLWLWGYASLVRGDYRQAQEALSRVGDMQTLGRLLEWAEALAKEQPSSAVAQTLKGDALARAGKYDQALTASDEAVRLDPDSALARYIRGNTYQQKDEFDRAIADYDKAIALNPTFSPAYSNRGVAYARKGDYQHALADYDKGNALIGAKSPEQKTSPGKAFEGTSSDSHSSNASLSEHSLGGGLTEVSLEPTAGSMSGTIEKLDTRGENVHVKLSVPGWKDPFDVACNESTRIFCEGKQVTTSQLGVGQQVTIRYTTETQVQIVNNMPQRPEVYMTAQEVEVTRLAPSPVSAVAQAPERSVTQESSAPSSSAPTASLDHPALAFGDVVVGPVRDIVTWAGAQLEWKEPTIAVAKGDTRLELTIGSRSARVNGRATDMPCEVKEIDTTAYAPLPFLAQTLGLRTESDDAAAQVTLHRDMQAVSLPIRLGVVPSWWPQGVPPTPGNLKDMQGRDILELVDQKKVEVKTQGSGIQSVSLQIRRLVDHKVTVLIPGGTFLVSHQASSQNMVTTQQTSLPLESNDWVTASVSAACADRLRNVPGSESTFDVQRAPNQDDLKRLMPVLEKANVSYAIKQAAIWIVTNDATYDDLGTLVSSPVYQVYGGTRVINEYEAAKAMKICDQAGINITEKAIWQSRDRIIQGLKDDELKNWLLQKTH